MSRIPQEGKTYSTYYTNGDWCICVYKRIGFTPLQVLNEIRPYLSEENSSRCTYAGRLDPMAEGWFHILWSGNAEEKQKLTSRKKVYEVEILLGVSTDTGDVLGLIQNPKHKRKELDFLVFDFQECAQSFLGDFIFPYPAYSSPNIKKTLKAEDVTIKRQRGSIDLITLSQESFLSSEQVLYKVEEKLNLCQMNGDFRLEKIQTSWRYFLSNSQSVFKLLKFEIICSSGTYMRTLAEEFGKKIHVPSLAFSIVRTKIIEE